MSIDTGLITYAVVIFATTVAGIVFGSWLNSKLLTRTFKGEIKDTFKGASSSKEYKTAVELINNLNDLLKSPEAKNFFSNATRLLEQMTGTPNDKPIFKMPSKTASTTVAGLEAGEVQKDINTKDDD